MQNLPEFLDRAANKCGFLRKFYINNRLPTIVDNIYVIPFFGNLWSMSILSTFILKRMKDKYPSRYYILCSWPGFKDLFPYVDEYWEIKSENDLTNFNANALNFVNESKNQAMMLRNLNSYFSNVVENFDMYQSGFTDEYYKEFENIKYYMPSISSSTILNERILRFIDNKKAIVLHPTKYIRSFQHGKLSNILIQEDFWNILTERLLSEGYNVLNFQNFSTYDMSKHFVERCEYLISKDIGAVLAALHSVGMALDFFNGFSRLAFIARCPFVAVDERNRFTLENESFLNQCTSDYFLAKQYVFSHASLFLNQGSMEEWNRNIIDNIIFKLDNLQNIKDNNPVPSTAETEKLVDASKIKLAKAKKMGIRFIKLLKGK